MLFNSVEFLFVFVPACLAAVWAATRFLGYGAGIVCLSVASLVFYARWNVQDVWVIAASIAFNYAVASSLASGRHTGARRLTVLWGGIAANLAALGYFKYWGFLSTNLNLLGASVPEIHPVLPLAISFYTFQQIAFLVDTYHSRMGRVPLRDYVVSVLFFPHLIAGPLIHYNKIIQQFETRFEVTSRTIWLGLPIFMVGLAKKVFIADNIALIVSPLYRKAETGVLDQFSAWIAALGYTAQLYFDFSGYSDMAIGLGLMFGITLPINFFSPYKATSIIEFWRRWHITLSSFLRDYLYVPLGGSRVGRVRRYVNLFVVMLLGGIWHGAGWTYVIWGALHGSYLVVNHLWRSLVGPRLPAAINAMLLPAYAGLTFLAVVVGWVFFRASTFQGAVNILKGMAGASPPLVAPELAYVLGLPDRLGTVQYSQLGLQFHDAAQILTLLALAFTIIFFCPNSAQLFAIEGNQERARVYTIGAIPRAALVGCLFWLACFSIFSAAPSEFLYFQF